MKRTITILATLAVLILASGAAFAQGAAATLPYTTGFESGDDNAAWQIINGAQINKWFFGSAASLTGNQGLYISNNASGTTNAYSNTSSAVFAVRTLHFPSAGQYAVTFDWRCAGEGSHDYLRCFLVPTSVTLSAGSLPSGVTATGTPSGWIDLGGTMNVTGTVWNNTFVTVDIASAGDMNLVFLWRNDNAVSNMPPAAVDNLAVGVATCPRPTGVTFDGYQTISWTAGGGETGWVWRLGNGAWHSTTAHSVTIDTLTPVTDYSFAVRSVCGYGDTSIAVNFVFRSPCEALTTFPYVLNFDSEPTGTSSNNVFPECLMRLNNGTQYFGFPFVGGSTYNHTPGGSRGLYWCNATTTGTYGDYQVVVLPAVDVNLHPLSTLQLSFWAKPSSASYSPQFLVGVMTDPSDESTFEQVAVVNLPNSTVWQQYEVPLSSYIASGRFVAIRANRPTTAWYAYVDDIVLDLLPSCPKPTNLTVTAVTDGSASLTWTDNTAGGYLTYMIDYRADGESEWTSFAVSDTAVTINGLMPNTDYSVRVRAICGATDTSSMLQGSFSTECETLTSLPYVQDFEQSPSGGATNANFDDCMHRLNNATQYYGYPYIGAATAYNHTPNGGRGLYWYNSTTTGTYGDYQIVALPAIDTDSYPINELQLRFWAKASSTSESPTFQVGVMTNPDSANTFHAVRTINIGSSAEWAEYSAVLGSYTGYGQYVAIRALRPATEWTALVDDITLESIPSCSPVVDIQAVVTAGSALLSWDYAEGYPAPGSYEVSYNSVGATGAPNTIMVADNYVTLTNLVAGVAYKAVVRADCGGGDYGRADSITFTPNFSSYIEVGTGTSETNEVPLNNYWNYSYTQELVMASEMSGAATLTGIDFQYAYTLPSTVKNNVSIYLANVTQNSLENSGVPYNAGTFQLVYSGNLNCSQGWNHFQFSTPFSYDGTSNLLVTVVDNSGAYDGSSYTFYAHSATGKARVAYNDDNTYNVSGTIDDDASILRANMRLCFASAAASCAAPVVQVVSTSSNEMTIAWAPGYDELSWNVEYRVAGNATWITLATAYTSTSYVVTGLASATDYEFRVSHVCSSDNNTYSGLTTGRTVCTAKTLPYVENFDSVTTSTTAATGVYVNCWDYIMTGTATYQTGSYLPQVYYSSTYANSGSYCLRLYGVGYHMLPEMDAQLDSLLISFSAYTTGSMYGLEVGVVEGGMFIPVDTVSMTTSVHNPVEVSLAGYHGSSRTIAFRNSYTSSSTIYYAYVYIDDIMVDYIPACPRVTGVGARRIDQTSAIIAWDSVDDHEVMYGPSGFAFGNGDTVVVYASDSVVLTGLSSNTAYDVYVRKVCSEGSTIWSFVYTFRTSCGLIDSLPYVEDFEGYASGSSNTTSPFIPCWTRLNNGTTYGGYPYLSNSTTYNHTSGGTGGLYWYGSTTSGSYGDYMYIILPEIDTNVLPINTLQLTFWAKASSSSYSPVLEVGVMSSNLDTAFESIGTINIAGSTDWTEYTVGLNTHAGAGSFIAIRALRPGSSWYAYVDDVLLEVLPDCARVLNVQAATVLTNSAVIYWTDTSSNSLWNVEYSTTDFVPGTGAVSPVSVTDTFAVLTGLDSATSYYVYVYPDCGGSVAARGFIFTTLAATPAALPYSCGFEDAGDNGWDLINGSQENYWVVGNAASNGGSRSLYITDDGVANSYSGSASYVFASRTVNIVDTGFYVCSFDWMCNGESSYDFLRAALVPAGVTLAAGSYCGFDNNAAVPAGSVPLDGAARLNANGTAWTTQTTTFHVTIPSTYRLVFMWHNDASVYNMPPAAIDNVSLQINTCPAVSDIHATALNSTSVTVDWTDNAGAIEWEVSYGSGAAATTVVTSTHPYTASGLYPMTDYTFRVRPICSVTDTGSPAVAVIRTGMCDNMQSAENWTSTAAATTSTYGPVGYSFYNYGYVQTIIDAADMAGITGDITAFAFFPTVATAGDKYNGMTVYMANVPEDNLSSGWILPNNTNHIFHKVIDNASFNYTDAGEQVHVLDSAFTWDGHSNVLVAVVRNNGSYSSGATFSAHTATGNKMRYVYQDGSAYNYANPGAAGTATSTVGDIRLISCDGMAGCPMPTITSVISNYSTATIVVSGNGNGFELSYGTSPSALGTTVTSTTGRFNLSGLAPNTQYFFEVVQLCDSGVVSIPAARSFSTSDMPCFTPTDLEVVATTFSSVTLRWTSTGNATQWIVAVNGAGHQRYDTVGTNPYTVSGLYNGQSYIATVRSACMVGSVESDWSDTVSFMTEICNPVTGAHATDITSHSAKATWNAAAGSQGYVIYYGDENFNDQDAERVEVAATSYTMTGLDPESNYEFYVMNKCGEGVYSVVTDADRIGFTTLSSSEGIYDVESGTLTLYPNPASSSVTVTVGGIDGEVTLEIVDLNGKCVRTLRTQSGEVTVDLTTLSQGAYFVRVTGERQTAVRKLIVR